MFEKLLGKTNDLDRLARKELDLVARKRTKIVHMNDAETAIGNQFLDSDDEPDVSEIGRIAAEIAGIDRAIHVCSARRSDAILLEFHAEAQALTKEVSEKRRELEPHEAKSAELLRQLATLEEAPYVPSTKTKSSRMRAEIDQMERTARELESKPVPEAGGIDLDQVITGESVALAAASSRTQAPGVEEVFDWLARCEQSAREICPSGFENHPRRVYVMWTAGQIDTHESYVYVQALAKVLLASDGTEYFDIVSGTFRAGEVTQVRAQSGFYPQEAPMRGDWYVG
jgi:hypothetical protein